jgi:hypothetical protein
MPDSEQMELTGTKYRKRHSVSVEQIQDSLLLTIFIWSKLQFANKSTKSWIAASGKHLPSSQ